MKVRFDEIPAEGSNLVITDDAWFPDHELERRGKVAAAVFLRRDGQRVFVDGNLSATVVLVCDRCLGSFERALAEDFQVEFELAGVDNIAATAGEHEVDVEEMDTVFLKEAAIDIYQVLQQQVFLALPEKILCDDECRGLCSNCGANLNKEDCRCGTKESNSPFGVLAGLKDKMK
ncbi:MAG: DUF177 domain-containing protein [Desulfobulbaceae bacterium]|nr:DUF177 domain-containing protein [Desulfobulbaceae bacterium]